MPVFISLSIFVLKLFHSLLFPVFFFFGNIVITVYNMPLFLHNSV